MLTILVPVFVAGLGALVWALSAKDSKAAMLGIIAYGCGLLVLTETLAHTAMKVLP